MNGVAMMLKSMGVDPEELKAQAKQVLDSATDAVMVKVSELEATQKRIENKIDLLHTKLDLVLSLNKETDDAVESGHLDTTL